MPSSLMLLSNPYRPDPRVLAEGRALTSAGFHVDLIAWDRDGGRPRLATEGGLDVLRVGPLCPPRSALKVLTRLPRFWWRALRVSRTLGMDVVHAHDFDTLPLGHLISRLKGKPLIYDAHELYAKMITNEAGPLSGAVWLAERVCARRADAIITVSDSLAEQLSKGREGRAMVVSTTQDPSVLASVNKDSIRSKYGLNGFVVSYLGSLEPGRFVEEFVTSFGEGDGVTMVVGGPGTLNPKIEELAKTNPALKYIGVVDSDEALKITYASDLVVAMMDPSNPNNVAGTPGKIINALACGRPVITSEGLQIAEKIREVNAGIVVRYAREPFREEILKAMETPTLLEEMGRNGRALYDKVFSWEKSKQNLVSAYSRLMNEK